MQMSGRACPAWAAGVDELRPHRLPPLGSSVDLHSDPPHATASCAPGPAAPPSLGRTLPSPGPPTTPLALPPPTPAGTAFPFPGGPPPSPSPTPPTPPRPRPLTA